MAPLDWTPSFSIYRSEVDVKPYLWALGSQDAAIEVAIRHGLKRFVIRRSKLTVMGERYNGQVVYTKN